MAERSSKSSLTYDQLPGADRASSPAIELYPLPGRAQYPERSAEHDQATLLDHEVNTRSPSGGFTIGYSFSLDLIFSRLGQAFKGPSQWRYTRADDEQDVFSFNNPFYGWRKSVEFAAFVTGVVLLINLAFAIVTRAKYPANDGIGVIFTGNCDLVKRWDTALHLMINVLGTFLLGASSYTMQCLASPTRSEVDAAHAKRRPMDIGIPSLKNMFHMPRWKGFLWWCLCLSTMPLHLFWNSTVFATLGANEFAYMVVTPDFLTGATYTYPNNSLCGGDGPPAPAQFLAKYREGNLTKLSASECITAYSATYVSSHGHFLAVSNTSSTSTRLSPACAFAPNWYANLSDYYGAAAFYYSGAHYGHPQPPGNGSSILAYEYEGTNQDTSWLCVGYVTDPEIIDWNEDCSLATAQKQFAENGTFHLRPYESGSMYASYMQAYPIDHCLSETKDVDRCQLQYVSYILYIVIACNIIKFACMCGTAYFLYDLKEPIFATVGDAVASFMERPDKTTANRCLLDYPRVSTWRTDKLTRTDGIRYDRVSHVRLYHATSKSRWWTVIGLCTLFLVVGCVLLSFAAQSAEDVYSRNAMWNLGLGNVNSSTVLGLSQGGASGLIMGVVIANVFQLTLSITYFLYNSLYTAQCSAIEWSSYTSPKRKALRVTLPQGQQRSTFYLQLPYRYSIPLTAFLVFMHFLISQSVFLARVQFYNNGEVDYDTSFSDVGFSPIAILVSICVGACLILAQIIHSFRWIDNRIPMHGNCSAVISALCHAQSTSSDADQAGKSSPDSADNMALRPVMWGVTGFREQNRGEAIINADKGGTKARVVREENELDIGIVPLAPAYHEQEGDRTGATVVQEDRIGHCSFTADFVPMPVSGRKYK